MREIERESIPECECMDVYGRDYIPKSLCMCEYMLVYVCNMYYGLRVRKSLRTHTRDGFLSFSVY